MENVYLFFWKYYEQIKEQQISSDIRNFKHLFKFSMEIYSQVISIKNQITSRKYYSITTCFWTFTSNVDMLLVFGEPKERRKIQFFQYSEKHPKKIGKVFKRRWIHQKYVFVISFTYCFSSIIMSLLKAHLFSLLKWFTSLFNIVIFKKIM